MPKFAVLDASGLLEQRDVSAMVEACRIQLQEHIAPMWGRVAPQLRQVAREDEIAQDEIPTYLLEAPGDTAGALGDHLEAQGRPVARVFVGPVLRATNAILWDPGGGPSVSSVLSHELGETELDETATGWLPAPDGAEVALEIADPDDGATYPLRLGAGVTVGLANFVGPRWFDLKAKPGEPCDHLGRILTPFAPGQGGFVIRREKNGRRQMTFGDRAPPMWKFALRFHSQARSIRRLQDDRRTP